VRRFALFSGTFINIIEPHLTFTFANVNHRRGGVFCFWHLDHDPVTVTCKLQLYRLTLLKVKVEDT